MQTFLTNLFTRIRLVLVAFFALPLISDIIEFFGRASVLSFLLGFVCYVLIPELPIPHLPPEAKKQAGDLVFVVTLGLVFRFSVEGILETRATRPQSQADYIRLIVEQVQTFVVQEIRKYLMQVPPKQPELNG